MPNAYPDADYPDQQLTGLIIASAYEVHRVFGYGFLEAVYKRAMAVEMRFRGVNVGLEARFDLGHRDEGVGIFKADILVERRVIVEVKTGLRPDPEAPTQALNYLCAADLNLALVLDFCPKLHIKRLISTPAKRHWRRRGSLGLP
ncbi:MAG: GxxExxY protein [Gemmatimonadaceae bacterium]